MMMMGWTQLVWGMAEDANDDVMPGGRKTTTQPKFFGFWAAESMTLGRRNENDWTNTRGGQINTTEGKENEQG